MVICGHSRTKLTIGVTFRRSFIEQMTINGALIFHYTIEAGTGHSESVKCVYGMDEEIHLLTTDISDLNYMRVFVFQKNGKLMNGKMIN